jgi:hypothetical protein
VIPTPAPLALQVDRHRVLQHLRRQRPDRRGIVALKNSVCRRAGM